VGIGWPGTCPYAWKSWPAGHVPRCMVILGCQACAHTHGEHTPICMVGTMLQGTCLRWSGHMHSPQGVAAAADGSWHDVPMRMAGTVLPGPVRP